MKINQLPIYFVLLLLFGGCSQMTFDDSVTVISKSIQDLRIAPGDTPITADDASKVAQLFIKNKTNQTKGFSTKEVKNVYIVSQKGDAIMYAVNFDDEKGFIVVSASRKYYPILAYVEKGQFDESFGQYGLGYWIDEQSEQIQYAEEDKIEESVSKEIRKLWSAFEKNDIAHILPTKSEAEAFALRQASVAAWEQQGYTCYALMDQPSNMPSSTYSTWCQLASSMANPDYNYMLYSVILEKRVDDVSGISPLIGSTWERGNGYNASLPSSSVLLPSRTVAIGQIMRKHLKPADKDWNNMPLTYATTTTANFLAWLTGKYDSMYLNGGEPTDNIVMYTLQYKLQYSATLASYSRSTVVSNLAQGKPVYLSGSKTLSGSSSSYAWVCEAYQTTAEHYEYQLKTLSLTEPLEYEHMASYSGNAFGNVNYLYHNLGLGGSLNGWYISDTFTAGSNTMQPTNMIYNITAP